MPENSKNYLDPKVLSRISSMEVRARLVVEGFISGVHRSPYNGYSVEFAQYREYVPGDDIRHIDWKVWGRADRFYLKQYEEETNMNCHIFLDSSLSMDYHRAGAADGLSKFDYAGTLAASLAYLIQSQQDAAGLVLFDNDIRLTLPPSTNPRQIRQLAHHLESATPAQGSDAADVFAKLPGTIKRRGLVVIISDLFVDPKALRDMLRQFRHKGNEVVVFHILHEDELTFPFAENTLFEGLEVDTKLMVEPTSLRKAYLEALGDFQRDVRRICTRNGCDFVAMGTHDRLGAGLSGYLAARNSQNRRGSHV